jgi:hypothetical protein
VLAQKRTEVVRGNDDVAALVELSDILRIFKTKPAEDAVAVEVDDVVRLAGAPGAVRAPLRARGTWAGRGTWR